MSKSGTQVFVTILPNIDQFSRICCWHILQEICHKVIKKDSTTHNDETLHHVIVALVAVISFLRPDSQTLS